MSYTPPNIACIGEAMLELRPADSGHFALSVAGDVLNTAAGIALLGGNSSFVSATGTNSHSDMLIECCAELQVDSSHITRMDAAGIGLYLISNDSSGERFFSYWREHSAAHQLLLNCAALAEVLADLQDFPFIYLTGISLSRTSAASRELLWGWLERSRATGSKLIYDANYRPALWKTRGEALQVHQRAIALSDIFLPGLEDEMALRKTQDRTAVLNELEALSVPEMVIKDGSAPLRIYSEGHKNEIPVTPINTVVDTAGAGDSFNAGYLASRLKGWPAVNAAAFAAKVSAMVIQHRGAIPPATAWETLSRELSTKGMQPGAP